MKYCQSCGSSLKEGEKFCPNCGVATDNIVEQKSSANASFNLEKREIVTCVILTLITCGIYGLVWLSNIVDDVNTICQDEHSNQSGISVVVLSLLTCNIYGLIWYYTAGTRLHNAGIKYNTNTPDNSLMYLILALFGFQIINYALIQSEIDKFSKQ